jgi:tight adherence protein B
MNIVAMRSMLQAGVDAKTVWDLSDDYRKNLDSSDSDDLETLWEAANKYGSAASKPLELFDIALTQRQSFQSELETALTTPKATARLLVWLPVIGLLSAQIVGLNPFQSLSSTLGRIIFGVAIGLTVLGNWITRRMFEKTSATTPRVDLEPLLMALRLDAGAALSADSELSPETLQLIKLSAATGAQLNPLLIASFVQNQQLAYQQAIANARELGVRVLIPLGLTSLPAFVLISVIPILISSLGSIQVK